MRNSLILVVCSLLLFMASARAQKRLDPIFPCTSTLESPYGLTSEITRRKGEFDIREESVDKLSKAGAGWVRLPMHWDVFYYDGRFVHKTYDAAMETLRFTPFALLGVISPSYDKKLNAWSDPLAFSSYVKELSFRYRHYISSWEVMPGMDYSFFNGKQLTPQQFYTTLRGVHKILKSANSQNKVVLGALNRVRSSFLDTLCKYDAQKYFDVMSFTSYGDAESITGQANGLKRTMRKYGFEKPVWMTSVYYGSMPVENTSDGFWMDVVPAALSKLGLSLKKTEVAVVTGLRREVSALNDYQIDRYLEGRFKDVHRISNTEIDSLDPQTVPVLIPGKNVPSSDVAAYMAKGGTVILEEPLWPSFTHIGVLNGLSQKAASAGLKAAPEYIKAAKGFNFTYSWKFSNKNPARYLTPENLQKGDEMIPLMVAGGDGYEGTVIAMYRLAAGGNVIVQSRKGTSPYVDTEDEQARRIPRVHLMSFACGIDKVFWHGLRSAEKEARKSHYGGLYHADFSPKPAATAYSVLTSMLPSGSTRPVLVAKETLYVVEWLAADGKKRWAVWSTEKTDPSEIEIVGKAVLVDYLGNKLKNMPVISDKVVYITEAEEVKIK